MLIFSFYTFSIVPYISDVCIHHCEHTCCRGSKPWQDSAEAASKMMSYLKHTPTAQKKVQDDLRWCLAPKDFRGLVRDVHGPICTACSLAADQNTGKGAYCILASDIRRRGGSRSPQMPIILILIRNNLQWLEWIFSLHLCLQSSTRGLIVYIASLYCKEDDQNIKMYE